MSKKILIIDDNEQELIILKRILGKAGYDSVVCAEGGEEGLSKARSERPDLIVLDINMPQKMGIEVNQIIKNDPELKHIPVVFHTHLILPGEQAGGGKIDILPKADSSQDVIKKVKQLLGG